MAVIDHTMWDDVPPLKQAWYAKKHLIADAIERGGDTHTLDEVEQKLDAGLAQFVIGERSAMVVEIKELDEHHRYLHIWLAGGDMDELIFLQNQTGAWAKQAYDCLFITLNGQRWKGWSRVLQEHGYEICLKKDL